MARKKGTSDYAAFFRRIVLRGDVDARSLISEVAFQDWLEETGQYNVGMQTGASIGYGLAARDFMLDLGINLTKNGSYQIIGGPPTGNRFATYKEVDEAIAQYRATHS